MLKNKISEDKIIYYDDSKPWGYHDWEIYQTYEGFTLVEIADGLHSDFDEEIAVFDTLDEAIHSANSDLT